MLARTSPMVAENAQCSAHGQSLIAEFCRWEPRSCQCCTSQSHKTVVADTSLTLFEQLFAIVQDPKWISKFGSESCEISNFSKLFKWILDEFKNAGSGDPDILPLGDRCPWIVHPRGSWTWEFECQICRSCTHVINISLSGHHVL